ncbi:MAG: contractile injection system protein, VgrG/Pvc8 family [Marinobacterium sp.]|nr:contractile injection system protein, VgrG/Pvc8 family [Marinobacterium sp.]
MQRISQSVYPNIITLTATSAPFHKDDKTELKKARTFSWQNTTVGGVVSVIARRHNFSPRVHGDLAGKVLEHVDQTGEADLTFLKRLAAKYDAACKPVQELLVFAPKGQLKSMTDKVLEPVLIIHPDSNNPQHPGWVSGTVRSPEKRQFKGFQARWYDHEKKKEVEEEIGISPQQRLPERFASRDEALTRLIAMDRENRRRGEILNLECPGNPNLSAEASLGLIGFPVAKMSQIWSIDQVTHRFDGSYRCSVEASRPLKAFG